MALVLWLTGIVGMGLLYLVGGVTPPSMAAWLQRQLAGMGAWGPFFYMGVYSLRSLILFPASILTIMGGLLFGPWWGMLYTLIGENISANLSFIVARYMGSAVTQRFTGRFGWLSSLDCAYRRNGFMSVLVMRLMFLPFDLVGYSAGACLLRQRDFAAATFLGTLPGLAVFILVGSSFTHPLHLLLAGIIFAVALVLSRFVKKRVAPDILPVASSAAGKR